MSYRGKVYFFLIFVQWQLVLLLTGPPMFGLAGRFTYEPSGTACTLDYWHGAFRNYIPYISFLTTFGFCVPMTLAYVLYSYSGR